VSTDLPRWVWDLLADLLDEEDTHPAYYIEAYVMSKGKHELVRHDWCPATPLARVPQDVLNHARVIAGYRQQSAERMSIQPDPEVNPGSAERGNG
jgi:hypothetical protein